MRAEDTTGLTATRAMMGTVQFAAPEALESAKDVGPCADVYSLGATAIFALLAGRLPAWFYRTPEVAVARLDCGERLQKVLDRAVTFEATERQASVKELCGDLQVALRPERRVAKARSKVSGKPPERERLDNSPPAVEEAEVLYRWRRPDGEMSDLWCPIPAGVGWIGKRDDEDGAAHESPRHRVEITRSFWMSAVPITNAMYQAFDPRKAFHRWPGGSEEQLRDHPRVNLTWDEAVSFCRWLSEQPGFKGTSPSLPEEEVWEYACRAGSETRFWHGDAEKDLREIGWYRENSGGRPHRVGGKPANEFGLYDVHGNVWEWTATQWDEKRYGGRGDAPHPVDPAGSAADRAGGPRVDRVVRGGSFWVAAQGCRSAYRGAGDPWVGIWLLGFRVLLSSAPSGLR